MSIAKNKEALHIVFQKLKFGGRCKWSDQTWAAVEKILKDRVRCAVRFWIEIGLVSPFNINARISDAI